MELALGVSTETVESTKLNITPIVPSTYVMGSPTLDRTAKSYAEQHSRPADQQLSILLVDDDPLTCKLMQKVSISPCSAMPFKMD